MVDMAPVWRGSCGILVWFMFANIVEGTPFVVAEVTEFICNAVMVFWFGTIEKWLSCHDNLVR
jgi:hypothetical protein